MSGTLIAILGAGRAARFGGGKLDAALNGRPLGQWALQTAQSMGAPVVWVAGPQAPAFLRPAPARLAVLHNTARDAGMGTSIALAAAHARAQGAGRLLLMLADMPFVSQGTLLALIAAAPTGGASACIYPDGAQGAPACFGADHFDFFTRLEADIGARKLFSGAISATGIAVSAPELRDIDSLADLEAAQNAP